MTTTWRATPCGARARAPADADRRRRQLWSWPVQQQRFAARQRCGGEQPLRVCDPSSFPRCRPASSLTRRADKPLQAAAIINLDFRRATRVTVLRTARWYSIAGTRLQFYCQSHYDARMDTANGSPIGSTRWPCLRLDLSAPPSQSPTPPFPPHRRSLPTAVTVADTAAANANAVHHPRRCRPGLAAAVSPPELPSLIKCDRDARLGTEHKAIGATSLKISKRSENALLINS